MTEVELSHAEWVQNRLDQLNLIEEGKAPRIQGDLVLRKMLPNTKDQQGKWAPNYKGPYVVKHAFSGGALMLVDSEG
ncbi:hypothetical protein CR513_62186, partial [Mucuna pruriens]